MSQQEIFEKKDLRITKLTVAKMIFEKTEGWGESQEMLADQIVAYVYASKSDYCMQAIKEYERKSTEQEQQPTNTNAASGW